MGTLIPGATYNYEHVDGITYAREFGTGERTVVGYEYKKNKNNDPLDYRHYMSDPKEAQLWHDIRQEARTNPSLQSALERVKIIYYLSKDKSQPPDWHPV
jgi:hypothetical protein